MLNKCYIFCKFFLFLNLDFEFTDKTSRRREEAASYLILCNENRRLASTWIILFIYFRYLLLLVQPFASSPFHPLFSYVNSLARACTVRSRSFTYNGIEFVAHAQIPRIDPYNRTYLFLLLVWYFAGKSNGCNFFSGKTLTALQELLIIPE